MEEEKKEERKGKIYVSRARELLVMMKPPEGEEARHRKLEDGTFQLIKEEERGLDFSPNGQFDTGTIEDNHLRKRAEKRIESDPLFISGEITELTEKDQEIILTQQDIEQKGRQLEAKEKELDENKKKIEDILREKDAYLAEKEAKLAQDQKDFEARQAKAVTPTPVETKLTHEKPPDLSKKPTANRKGAGKKK